MQARGKKQWIIGLAGFGAGVLVMMTGNVISNLAEKNDGPILDKEILQGQEQRQQELMNEVEINRPVIGDAGKTENVTGVKTASSVEISKNFAERLILYQYIEYGLRKYSEDNDKNDRYFCNIEEDLLSCDVEFAMKNEWDAPYKTDLSKEIISELANNVYNFRLKGINDTIYMSIDTYNMKIYVYDRMK